MAVSIAVSVGDRRNGNSVSRPDIGIHGVLGRAIVSQDIVAITGMQWKGPRSIEGRSSEVQREGPRNSSGIEGLWGYRRGSCDVKYRRGGPLQYV
jgi:hypothetical protein